MSHYPECKCGACGWHGEAERPTRLWYVANIGFYVLCIVWCVAASLLGPLMIVLSPAILAAGAAVGYTADRAAKAAHCPRCSHALGFA